MNDRRIRLEAAVLTLFALVLTSSVFAAPLLGHEILEPLFRKGPVSYEPHELNVALRAYLGSRLWVLLLIVGPPLLAVATGLYRSVFAGRVDRLTTSVGFGGLAAASYLALMALGIPFVFLPETRGMHPTQWLRLTLWGCLAIGIGVGIAAWFVTRRWGPGPEWGPRSELLPSADIAPTETPVWMGSVKGPTWLRSLVWIFLVGAWVVVIGTSMVSFRFAPTMFNLATTILFWVAIASAITFLALVRLYTTVIVSRRGVLVMFGPWRWPRKHIAIEDVDRAEVQSVRPIRDFGGYGLRWRPQATAIVLRTGEALWLRRRDRWFVVTVDGAEEAAGVVNDLIASRAPTA